MANASLIVGVVCCSGRGAADELEKFSCDTNISSATAVVLAEYHQRIGDTTNLPSSVDEVKALLATMRRGDQGVQLLAMGLMGRCGVRPDSDAMRTVMLTGRAIGETNKDLLARIIDERGWPVISIYGEDADQTAFLIAQHADRDPAFQQKVLEILAEKLRIKETSAENYALLFDRVQIAGGKPQLYGSQGGCDGKTWKPKKMEDPENVDQLRRSVGLEPLVEYSQKVSKLFCAGGG